MKNSLELKRKYRAGSQMWFEQGKRFSRDNQLRGFGCGLVAALDFGIYRGELPPSDTRSEYKERIRDMARHGFFIMPNLGIAPYYYPLLANHFFRKGRMPYRITGTYSARNTEAVKRMLEEDLPVIFAAGPTVPFLGRSHRIPMYVPDEKTQQPVSAGQSVRAHYMTVLGLERIAGELWLKVASWGREYLIRHKDYVNHTKYCFPGTNRFYRIKKTDG